MTLEIDIAFYIFLASYVIIIIFVLINMLGIKLFEDKEKILEVTFLIKTFYIVDNEWEIVN
jgi:hypothetical protein